MDESLTEVGMRKKDKIQLSVIWGAVLIIVALMEYWWHNWTGSHLWDLFVY